jgi:hypothetical protein
LYVEFVETGEFEETTIAHLVAKAEIAKNGDFNGERYKITAMDFPYEKLETLLYPKRFSNY